MANANNNNHLVLMAGGVGSRFWPMSTEQFPKQFVDVLGVGRSLLQLTYDRLHEVVPAENVWVLTNRDYASIVAAQLPEIPASHILLEPCRRSTAPCIAYAAWRIKKVNAAANIVVAPSDALVLDVPEFQRVVIEGLAFASESDAIITLGMRPTRPETGYGYIQADLSSPSVRHKEIFRVDRFREKPDLALAKEYISQKEYFWNAGIFIMSVSTIVNAFRVYQPVMSRIFEDLFPVYGTPEEQAAIDLHYPDCENISIDYAIMEKADEIFVFPASFGWSDLGMWSSLRDNSPRDAHGNALIGPNIKVYDCNDCIIHATQEKKVAVQGLDGYVVVEKDGTLLICKLSEEQKIKQFAAD
ncbi:MAG: mannose-1-phosphate guanylyltransferase [Prevotella sp.]|nr:mannose-1-phosphate guanylyltransferase [Prevotella sp.]